MANFTKSKGWKVFMNFAYNIGASIVLLGALFKLQHWPGGSIMLTIGMLTEVIIFALGVFEKQPEMPNWSLVYPQLKGKERNEHVEVAGNVQGTQIAVNTLNTENSNTQEMPNLQNISPDMMKNVENSLKKLSEYADQFKEISEATFATKEYLENVKQASGVMEQFVDNSSKINDEMNETLDMFAQNNKQVGEKIQTLLSDVEKRYAEVSSVLTESSKVLEQSIHGESQKYSKELETVVKNLSTLNKSYKDQVDVSNKHAAHILKMNTDVEQMNGIITHSVKGSKEYLSEVEKLNKHLTELNHVYGDMLGVLSNGKAK